MDFCTNSGLPPYNGLPNKRNKVAGGDHKGGGAHLGHNKDSHVEKSPKVGYSFLHGEDWVLAKENFENREICLLNARLSLFTYKILHNAFHSFGI